MNSAKIVIRPDGISIKDLKDYLNDLPETNETGEPFEVWIETEKGLSNPAKAIYPLNWGDDGSDIILLTEIDRV